VRRALALLVTFGLCGCDWEAPVDAVLGLVEDAPGPEYLGADTYRLGVPSIHFPWKGEVRTSKFELPSNGTFDLDYSFEVDMSRAERYADAIEALYVVVVGEPVYRKDGSRTGFFGLTLATRMTVAGIPLEAYEGTLPVRAFGSMRGSPFEAVAEFPVKPGSLGRPITLEGTLKAPLSDLEDGWYRPHVELFVKLKGSEKRIDLRHLGINLGRWVDDRASTIRPQIPNLDSLNPLDLKEFMKDAQVLPNVRVGDPEDPRLIFALFADVAAHGQSGLLADQDQGRVGISNRSRFPTPLILSPGRWATRPAMPGVFPSTGAAGLFQGFTSLTRDIESWLDMDSGWFKMWITGPDGERKSLGERRVDGDGDDGLELEEGAFVVVLERTGEYVVELEGCFDDIRGRSFCGGGTYRFTCALPMSFSTAVKPGTNFLVGARYPAVLDINPAVAAHVKVDIDYFPGSDPEKVQKWVVEGDATRFGYFAPDPWPPRFEEPGEYRSLLTVSWTDRSGNLWMGTQTSAGVIAPKEPEVSLHGARTYLFDPHPDLDELGSFDRYNQPVEGGSSFADHSNLSLYDHTFPYWSGDTLFVSTTYPLESVIGPTLSMAARSPATLQRFEDAYLPNGPLPPYPLAPRDHELVYLPHISKVAEDNFSYHRLVPGEMDQLPIVPSSRKGLSPYAWPEEADLDAYVYLSVIRPGLPVLALAFQGSFQAPCWIISPNDYGYRFHSSPNGDLPEDIYRVMAGLVVKDNTTGKSYYDAYSSAIRILPPGSGFTAVQPAGEIPITSMAGHDHYMFLGLNTSGVYSVGHELLLGGTLMPPAPADVHFDIEFPSGRKEVLDGRANQLGGFSPPRAIVMDEPGVYRVKLDISRENAAGEVVTGDVVGSGDGEILYFALPEEAARVFASPLPAISRITDLSRIEIPLGWHPDIQNPRLYWSVMTPGSLFDEDYKDVEGNSYDFVFRPRQAQIQLPNLDSLDYGTGEPLLTDIMVFVFYLEGTLNGERVYDALRVVLRGDTMINPDALIQPELLRQAGIDVGAPLPAGASYPRSEYRRPVDLDGLRVTHVGDEE
jgi:hypothetical protein